MSPNTQHQLKIALQHHQSGRLNDAEVAYRAALEDEPGNSDALYLLGVLKLQLGDAGAALGLLERAIDANPDQPDYYNMCGEAHQQLRDFPRAVSRYQDALAIKPDFAGAHINIGNAFKEMGQPQEAINHYEQAIVIEPRLAMAYNNLGVVFQGLGRLEEAAARFRQALDSAPELVEAHTNFGNLLLDQGRPEEAIRYHERAIALHPGYAEAYCNLGRSLAALGRNEEAAYNYDKAVSIKPDFALAHNNLGIVQDDLRRPEQAIKSYEKALDIEPGYADAHNNLANALDELGLRDEAVLHYRHAIEARPEFAEARRHLARLAPSVDQTTEIEELLAGDLRRESEVMHLHYALGDIELHRSAFDRAFDHFQTANEIRRSQVEYDPDKLTRYVDKLIEVFTNDELNKHRGFGTDSECPVFIVGMPRSGTTLVEQIAASHPQVFGGGELELMQQTAILLEEAVAGNGSLHDRSESDGHSVENDLAEGYLAKLREFSSDALRITDKAPGNFLRIGHIKILFPRARIVHCKRNAFDTCTSAYFTYFVEGHEFSYSLDELARYYVDYFRLMQHWSEIFAGEILQLDYEDLVEDQEVTSRKLIDYLGLEWDRRCLDYFDTSRAIRTASSAQVRRPIYKDSVNRWKHFEKQLAPLSEILQRHGIVVPTKV